jgi:hypothetical protein
MINHRGRTTKINDSDKSTFLSYTWRGGADTQLS